MTRSLWQRSTLDAVDRQFDVVIIGAGITGLSVAFWLTQLSQKTKVLVVDQAGVAHGASGRNAGFNTAGSAHYLHQLIMAEGLEKARAYWDFKQRSLSLMRQELFPRFACDQGFNGSTTLYRDSQKMAEALEAISAIGGFEALSAQELSAQGLNGAVGGLVSTKDGSLHPVKLLEALQFWLQQQGVQFALGQQAGWVEGDRLVLEGGVVQAPQFFLCTNGYAGQFAAELESSVFPKRAQMVALSAPKTKLSGNFYDPAHRVYFRQTPTGEVLLGGMRLVDESRENTAADALNQKVQAALVEYGQLHWPESHVLRRWSGIMGFTQDEKALIVPLTSAPQVLFVGGYSGHGMGVAFGVARSAVEKFLGRASS